MKRLNVLFSIRKLSKQLSYIKNELFSFGNLDIGYFSWWYGSLARKNARKVRVFLDFFVLASRGCLAGVLLYLSRFSGSRKKEKRILEIVKIILE